MGYSGNEQSYMGSVIGTLRGRNLDRLMQAVFEVYARWNARVPTGRQNQWLEAMAAEHTPPLLGAGRRIRLRYMTQLKSRPPIFAIWVSRPDDLAGSYRLSYSTACARTLACSASRCA